MFPIRSIHTFYGNIDPSPHKNNLDKSTATITRVVDMIQQHVMQLHPDAATDNESRQHMTSQTSIATWDAPAPTRTEQDMAPNRQRNEQQNRHKQTQFPMKVHKRTDGKFVTANGHPSKTGELTAPITAHNTGSQCKVTQRHQRQGKLNNLNYAATSPNERSGGSQC